MFLERVMEERLKAALKIKAIKLNPEEPFEWGERNGFPRVEK